MEPNANLSCVIFDVDGTLTRTNELIFASFNHVLAKRLGKTMTPREIIALFGPPEEDALGSLLGREEAASAMDELCEYYRAHHCSMASLHPGVGEVLSLLQRHGVHCAVFTGKSRRTVGITLEELGIAHHFDLVVSGTDVVNHKPHPEGIAKVLQTFGISPEHVLMVGDAISDIRASRGAGVKVAAALWDSYDREGMAAAGADVVFHTVGDMLDWFQASLNGHP